MTLNISKYVVHFSTVNVLKSSYIDFHWPDVCTASDLGKHCSKYC